MKLYRERKTERVRSATPPSDVAELALQKKALIIVERDFDEKYVPDGYTKLKLKTPSDEFIGLVPSSALFYLDRHNISGGNLEEGLDVLSKLYSEIEAANDVFGDSSRINVGGIDFAMTVRSNYQDLCVNNLIKGQGSEKDGKAKHAEYDEKEAIRLCLDHSYVAERMKAIAAVASGKSLDEIVELQLSDTLGFQKTPLTEHINERLFRKITVMKYKSGGDPNTKTMRCLGDSHYYLKDEYKNSEDGWDYDLRTMQRSRVQFDAASLKTIQTLEGEISEYQKNHSGGKQTPHDKNLTRMAIDMKFGAKLDVNPAEAKPTETKNATN